MNEPTQRVDRGHVLAVAIVLALATLVVYARTGGNDFVNYDDSSYVYRNPPVLDGLSPKSVVWAFTESHSANWHPLTWLSHMLDVQLFGLDAGDHHLTSAVLHALNVVLCLLAFLALTGRLWPSALVAALFALHPLRVESVAWIAERKDVLSGAFFFLTLWLYARYARAPSPGRLVAFTMSFALGLLAKPMLVTLPFVLLLLDVWPLRRWKGVAGEEAAALPARALLMEKLPVMVLAAISVVVTVTAQQAGGTIGTLGALPLDVRLINAVRAYGAYLWESVWPVGLAVFYPHPALVRVDPVNALYLPAILSGIVIATVTVLVLGRLRRAPYLAVGWLWYLGMLVPVIGIVQVGSQSHADRYAYLPLVGVYVALAFGIDALLATRPRLRQPVSVAALLVVGVFAALTWRQIGFWKDSETLNLHALDVTRDNYVAHNNLGLAYLKQEDPVRAGEQFELANEINPIFLESRFNLGLALQQQGRLDEAKKQFEAVLRLHPDDAEAQLRIGMLLEEGKDPAAARAHYEALVQADPHNAGAWVQLARLNLEAGEPEAAARCAQSALDEDASSLDAHLLMGTALQNLGDPGGALEQFTAAIEIAPDDAHVRAQLGRALANNGDIDEAERHLQRALDVDPNLPDALVDLAKIALSPARKDPVAARGYLDRALAIDADHPGANDVVGVLHMDAGAEEYPEAERCFEKALETDPDHASTLNNLGFLRELQKRERDAVECYSHLLEVAPRSPAAPTAARALAWIHATSPDDALFDGAEAERWAELAVQIAPNPIDPQLGNVMAAAKAASGDFESAVRIQEQVLQMTKGPAQRKVVEERLELYRQGRPFRRPER